MNNRNFVPVSVWKHVSRNLSVSSVSSPVTGTPGFGYECALVVAVEDVVGVDVPDGEVTVVVVDEVVVVGGRVEEMGIRGVMERVMAWTLREGWLAWFRLFRGSGYEMPEGLGDCV